MSVGLFIISHDDVGDSLLSAATTVLGCMPIVSRCLAVGPSCKPVDLDKKAKQVVKDLDEGDGVLVLTDIYGSTPGNVACVLLETPSVAVVSGVNLPMLLRVFNYPNLSLDELVKKAISGGREGIMDCRSHQF